MCVLGDGMLSFTGVSSMTVTSLAFLIFFGRSFLCLNLYFNCLSFRAVYGRSLPITNTIFTMKCMPTSASNMIPYMNLSIGSVFHAEYEVMNTEISIKKKQLIWSRVRLLKSEYGSTTRR